MSSTLQSDGQLLKMQSERFCPPAPCPEPEEPDCAHDKPVCKKPRPRGLRLFGGFGQDEMLILALIFLVVSGGDDIDMMLILALIYILMDF